MDARKESDLRHMLGVQPSSDSLPSKACVLRLRNELRSLAVDLPAGIIAEVPDEANVCLWTGYVQGPAGSAWADRLLPFELRFPVLYPYKPPSLRFVGDVFHPNVFATGRLCMDILVDQWSLAFKSSSILMAAQSLLASPNFNVAANVDAAAVYIEHGSDAWQARARRRFDASMHAVVR